MSTKRSLWMAKDACGSVCLYQREPVVSEDYKCWQDSGGLWSVIKELFPDSRNRTIISKSIKKPWRESKCRVFITIKEA